jgi:trimeric autotransporter adhesin
VNPSIQLKKTIRLLVFALVCFAISPMAQAVSPPPDGGYLGQNTAEGEDALFSLTSGSDNTAVGFDALFSDRTGVENTATGSRALFSNTNGFSNTATGKDALLSNTGGFDNTATGVQALVSNTSGNLNTATGFEVLFFNTTGSGNTADGFATLQHNTTGTNNIASGIFALFSNTTGSNNTADGESALYANTTGSGNIALGTHAGSHLTTGDNNIDIGNQGVRDEPNTIRIGTQGVQTKTFIAGISDAAIGGMEVRVNQNGRLGTVPSSKRFKEGIKPMDKTSGVLLALRPVTFHYKPEIDREGIPQFGLVAEEVEKVNPDLVVRDKEGKPYSVRYDQVNAMLLNEFLKEHRKVEELEANAARQQKQIEALTAGLQKVSAQIEVNKPPPQTVLNNRESSRQSQ